VPVRTVEEHANNPAGADHDTFDHRCLAAVSASHVGMWLWPVHELIVPSAAVMSWIASAPAGLTLCP
jgi:hypothetical protein